MLLRIGVHLGLLDGWLVSIVRIMMRVFLQKRKGFYI